ncbi:MAG: glycosyltransferase family 4 protein [Candidatus Gracilibacteria bacterium]
MSNVAKTRVLVTRFPYESQFGGEELHTLAVVSGLDNRGVPSFFLGSCPVLLRGFLDRHFDVKKVWLAKPPVTFWRLISFTLLSPVLFLLCGVYLWSAKKRWKVSTVYMLSLSEKLLMTPWAKFFGMKILWLEHARIGRWLTKNPWRVLYTFLSRFSTVVVTSNAMEPILRPYAKTVVVIPCGTIVEEASNISAELASFMKEGFAIGCVARLSHDKGVDMLVQAVHSKPDTRLVLVGQGPLKKDLQKRVDPARVRFVSMGTRAEMMAFYKALDLFVLPAREMDPFGMAGAEAMWSGVPCILSNKCGLAFDLHDGKEALIVEPCVPEIDRAIKKLMKHPELSREIALNGQRFVRSHYVLEDMIDRFDKLIELM